LPDVPLAVLGDVDGEADCRGRQLFPADFADFAEIFGP